MTTMRAGVWGAGASAVVLVGGGLLGGCASAGKGGSGAQGRIAVLDDETAGRTGAIDEAFRRATGTGSASIFDPLDLPTPTEVRLATGEPGPAYWQQRVDYTIDCRLDPATQRLDAQMGVTYHNNSPHALEYLWIQLEQNVFTPDSLGTLSRSGGGPMRQLEDGFDGGYTLGELTIHGVAVPMTVYDTLARVDLPTPLAPGQTLRFDLPFAFDMPPHLRRMGSEKVEQGTIFEYAQWFPHVCVYDDVDGWNTLPYLGSGEFYTNFGSYRVNITVPWNHLVAATGTLLNPGEVLTVAQQQRLAQALASDEPVTIVGLDEVGSAGARPAQSGDTTWRFAADDVRTFAWASSEAFAWDAAGAEVTDPNGTRRRVLVQSFYPKEAIGWRPDHAAGGSTRMLGHSVEFYSDFLHPYPYPQMTNVNGPEGGMEYPMILFCGDRNDDNGPFHVTDHEVGHNWFPMAVNTDERRHVWMDEGFNSFINLYSNAAWEKKGRPSLSRGLEQARQTFAAEHPQAMATAPDKMWPRFLGRLGYRKPAVMLYLLREEVLGPERFDRAFREYTRRWWFRSPQPADFYRTMSDVAGAELDWFWRGWVTGSGELDQGVEMVGGTPDGQRVLVDLVNHGEIVMPVRLRATFADGSTEDLRLPVEIWHATTRWRVAIPTGGRTLTRVELDPEGVYPDSDTSDNAWPR